jgi:hypothetical protein
MKILLTCIAIALAGALAVSATFGADTILPGGDGKKKTPRGGVVSSGKARILPTSFTPLTLKGTGFKPGENVTVRVLESAAKGTKRVRATSSGAFTLRLGTRIDRCKGMSVTATGDKGSRTSFQFAELLCAAP